MPTVNCPGCSRAIAYEADEAGQTFQCAKCGMMFKVETPAERFDFYEGDEMDRNRWYHQPWNVFFMGLAIWVAASLISLVVAKVYFEITVGSQLRDAQEQLNREIKKLR